MGATLALQKQAAAESCDLKCHLAERRCPEATCAVPGRHTGLSPACTELEGAALGDCWPLRGHSTDTPLWLAACCHPFLPREPPGPQDTSAVGLEAASPTSLWACSHCDYVAVGGVGRSHELACRARPPSSSQRHTPAGQRLSQREQDPHGRPEPGPAGLHAWSCPTDPVL